jgi:hypothetical protein
MTGGGWLTRIADADAGLPDEESAARVLAAGGPGTARVLEALAATREDLRALPPTRLPTGVAGALAAGFDAVDRAEGAGRTPGRGPRGSASHPAPVAGTGTHLTTHRPPVPATGPTPPRRRRRTLVLTAAAAGLVAVVLTGPAPTPSTDLASAAGRVLAEQSRDVGPLADPRALASCLLRAGAAAPGGPLLAGRPVRLDGTDGVLLVIGTGSLGRVRAVVPRRDCSGVLADVVVGG